MATAGPPIVLWLKAEPFTIGSLPTPPHPRLTVNNIKKIVTYAKSKGKSGFPQLSYSVWKHIACNKLQLPEDIAWAYFTTFDLISDSTNEERLEFDRRMSRLVAPHEIESLRATLTVPTLKFVLFLYIQHLHKISLRASLVSGSDEWPTRTRSPDLEGRSSNAATKTVDENSHMTFVLNNLNEILDLLVEPDSFSGGGDSRDLCLSPDALEALGFLFAGSADGNRSVKRLHEIAVLQYVQQKSGYSKISRSFLFRSLQTWLRSNVTQNPFGVSACIAQGRHLSWPLAGEDKESKAEKKRGKIATNALFVPKEHVRGNKLIVMSQVCRQTVARSSSTLEGTTVKIHRCHNSFIYLLSPLRSVSIEKCHDSTVVLGPVEATVDLLRCERTTVIAVCRRFTTSGSKSCTIHVLTPSRPLVFSGNESLIFAPYHTFYPRLDEHMFRAGLYPLTNLWDQPLNLGSDHQDDSVWELMKPIEFFTFVVPFAMPGDTQAIPGGLPARYQKVLQQRAHQVETWRTMVSDARLSKEQKKAYKRVIESRFQEWLQASGRGKELDGLAAAPTSSVAV